MADDDLPFEPPFDRDRRDMGKRTRLRVVGLVDVKIEIEVPRLRQREHAVEKEVEVRFGRRHGAEDSAVLRYQVGEAHAGGLVAEPLDRDQRNTLQCHAALPFGAHCPQQGPGNLALLTNAVDMRAHRARAVRVGATEPETHARGDVCCRPMCSPVSGDGGSRGLVAPVGVGTAWPDMTLVKMGVDVGKARPHHAAVEIDRRAALAAAGRCDPHDPAALDGEVELHRLVFPRIRLRPREQCPRHRCVAQHVGRFCRERQCRHLSV